MWKDCDREIRKNGITIQNEEIKDLMATCEKDIETANRITILFNGCSGSSKRKPLSLEKMECDGIQL